MNTGPGWAGRRVVAEDHGPLTVMIECAGVVGALASAEVHRLHHAAAVFVDGAILANGRAARGVNHGAAVVYRQVTRAAIRGAGAGVEHNQGVVLRHVVDLDDRISRYRRGAYA